MAKKNSVPARQHQYVKRKKKFIEMPMDQFIKICAAVVAVILIIVLFFVLRSAFDGHLSVVDGAVVTEGDNWILVNNGTSAKPRYFKLGEAGDVEGYTKTPDTAPNGDVNNPAYVYTPAEEGKAEITVRTAGVKYSEAAANVYGQLSFPNLSALDESDVAGRHARTFSFYVEDPAADVDAATDAENAPETEEGAEPATEPAATSTYTKLMYVYAEAARGSTVAAVSTIKADSADKLPDDAAMKAEIERVLSAVKFE